MMRRHSGVVGLMGVVIVAAFSGSVNGQSKPNDRITTQPYKILKGTISRKDYQRYIEAPFVLPKGVKRLTVEFSYNKKEDRTTVDLGLLDPQGFRGWSGGARKGFTISREEATPGYFSGPLPSGTWKLLLGIPNIRTGVIAEYEAKVFIDTITKITEFYDRPICAQPGWYRGDLHMHSGNSDGKCVSQEGDEVPTPVYRVAAAAVNKGLDFIALTDHNTRAQSEALRELEPAFNKILFVPGQEITTFFGHANVFGLIDFLDFRMTQPSYAQAKKWMDVANRSGGIISINHPGVPSGENCMGCGWQIDHIPNKVITAVELINGGSLTYGAESFIQGWNLWHKMLKEGQQVTAIGGSDDHHAGEKKGAPGTIGNPTTVVYMKELSVKGMLDGIRSGRVFIDIDGKKDHFLDLSARTNANEAYMGNILEIKPFDSVYLTAEVAGVPNGKVEFILDGELNPDLARTIPSDQKRISVSWKAGKGNHFIYAKVSEANGKLVMVSNPVYIKAVSLQQ